MAVSYRVAVTQALEAASSEHAISTDELLRYARLQEQSLANASDLPSSSGGVAAADADPVALAAGLASTYARIQSELASREGRLLFGSDHPTALDVHVARQQGIEGYASLQEAAQGGRFSRADTRANLLASIAANDYARVTGEPFTLLHALQDDRLTQAALSYWAAVDTLSARESLPVTQSVAIDAQGAGHGPSGTRDEPLVWPTPGNWNAAANGPDGGVVIHGAVGDPVLAVAAGRAAVMPNNGAAGHSVRVHHDDGVISGYRHLDSLPVQHDSRVAAGDKVGTLGRTGRLPADATPQLHLQMWRDGRALDALEELRTRGAAVERPVPGLDEDRSEFVDRVFAAARTADDGGIQQAISAFSATPAARQWEGAASLETTLVESTRSAAEPQR